ncbi:MAG: hypothetical protein A2Y10_16190 [Planctomycetes bacterium GWF2_41_51]|nr:MAG: hypothetical protein A2Y10_16190 [Planctomycetes bacterium GWF2_41_51]HBG26588.1 hypothetical protein [Phycisphaerales bacterium]
MAKEEKKAEDKKPDDKKKETAKTEKGEKTPAGKIGLMTWLIVAVVVIVFAGSGFVIGRLLANPQPQEKAEETAETAKVEDKKSADAVSSPNDTWYFNDLESVVVNPDEPGATRYVRVGLILEMGSEITQDKASGLITAKKPLLINWLNLYFKSMTLGEMQNDRDMKRILTQICDAFNEILFPGQKPHIKKILIREFNIQ